MQLQLSLELTWLLHAFSGVVTAVDAQDALRYNAMLRTACPDYKAYSMHGQ